MSDAKQQLESSIAKAIEDIRQRKVTPKKSGIGRMFSELAPLCMETHDRLLSEYRPVANQFFAVAPRATTSSAEPVSRIERELDKIERNISFSEDDFDEDGYLKQDVRARIIADATAKIEGRKVKAPKPPKREPGAPVVRDRCRYEFRGKVYGKGPLVLAIVRDYVTTNKKVDHAKLKSVFSDDLLKSYGIFKREEDARDASKVRKRYFLKPDQIIAVADCNVAVCNQFTSDNIAPFIAKAKSLGYDIKEEQDA